MRKRSLLVLLLSSLMVLSAAFGVFADTEEVDSNTSSDQQQEVVVDATEDEAVQDVTAEPAKEAAAAEDEAAAEDAAETESEEAPEADEAVLLAAPEAKSGAAATSEECTHKYSRFEIVLGENITYIEEEGDNESHIVRGDVYMVEYCADCDVELSREPLDQTYRPHNYNENHVCVDCGHKNSCQHTAGRESEIRYNEPLTYEEIEGDDINHWVKGDIYTVEYCSECGEDLKWTKEEKLKETHSYGADHICTECGHKNACEHPSTYTWYDYDDDVVVQDCGKDHSITGKIYEVTECEICGEEFSRVEVPSDDLPIYENHEYDEFGECIVCGHERNANWSADGNYYYEGGKAVKGWKQIDGDWYYFDSSSGKKKTGWLKYGDYWYYLDPEEGDYGEFSGVMATEWAEVDGKWYYLDPVSGRMKTGWFKLTETDEDTGEVYSDWYYFNSGGVQLFGWQKINNVWYYLEEEDEEGNMAYGRWYVATSQKVYMFDQNGKWLDNFTKWYSEERIDEEGNTHTDWYYFNKGTALKGWQKLSGNWYYFDSYSIMASNSWAKDSGGWCWLQESGRMATDKWIEDKGNWYYIKPDGHMAASTWLQDENGYRWVDAGGKNPRGKWFMIGNEWYCSDADGYRLSSCWASDSTGTYWLDKDGKITISKWIFDEADGEWYFMNSEGHITVSKWVKDTKEWYLLDADGHIVREAWAKDSKGWLYLDKDGLIARNCWVKDSAGTLWAGSDGYQLKNQWIVYEGDRYYVNANGYRVEGKTITIDGKSYTFDSKGRCLN